MSWDEWDTFKMCHTCVIAVRCSVFFQPMETRKFSVKSFHRPRMSLDAKRCYLYANPKRKTRFNVTDEKKTKKNCGKNKIVKYSSNVRRVSKSLAIRLCTCAKAEKQVGAEFGRSVEWRI